MKSQPESLTKICQKCGTEKAITEFYKRKDRPTESGKCKGCASRYQKDYNKLPGVRERKNIASREYVKKKPKQRLLINARQRAKKAGVPYSITENDIRIPSKCPILGIELISNDYCFHDASPSLDRIVPHLGYVPGNVAVISYRANCIKNNATSQELRLVASWIDAMTA